MSLFEHSKHFGESMKRLADAERPLDHASDPGAEAARQMIVRIWEMIPDEREGAGYRRVFKTFVLKSNMTTDKILVNASRKIALKPGEPLSLYELTPGGRPRKMEASELPQVLLEEGKKLVFCKGENDFVPIEVTSGDLKTAFVSNVKLRDDSSSSSSSSASGSSSSSSSSHKKQKKGKGKVKGPVEMVISAPVNMVHKTHVDENFTWTSEIGGNVADQFEKSTKLGEGAYGAVFKAIHKESGFVLALKVIKMSTSKTKQEEILHEIEVLKKCANPNIVQYYGCFFLPEALHILMDFCEMGSVLDMMKTLKLPLTEAQVAAVIWGSCRGLKYLHSQNIVHLDMKSANVLMNNQGQIKLADFGVSAQLADQSSHATGAQGTPYFMAPEVLEGKQYSFSADIWSLAITAIEMAEMTPPYFQDPPMRAILKICNEPNPPTFKDAAKFSQEFLDFVDKCLQREPVARFSASQLLTHAWIRVHEDNEGTTSQRGLWELVDKVIVSRGNTPPVRHPPEPKPLPGPLVLPDNKKNRKNRLSATYDSSPVSDASKMKTLLDIIETLRQENAVLKEKLREKDILIHKLQSTQNNQ